MPTVFVRGSRSQARFHRTEDCIQAQRRHPSGHQELRAVDLDDLPRATPCLVCYPDAPRAKSNHLRCPQCNVGSPQPCAHNGGVAISQTITQTKTGLLMQQVDEWEQTRYVWPENLRHHLVLPR